MRTDIQKRKKENVKWVIYKLTSIICNEINGFNLNLTIILYKNFELNFLKKDLSLFKNNLLEK